MFWFEILLELALSFLSWRFWTSVIAAGTLIALVLYFFPDQTWTPTANVLLGIIGVVLGGIWHWREEN